jgi:hypothetical protein
LITFSSIAIGLAFCAVSALSYTSSGSFVSSAVFLAYRAALQDDQVPARLSAAHTLRSSRHDEIVSSSIAGIVEIIPVVRSTFEIPFH